MQAPAASDILELWDRHVSGATETALAILAAAEPGVPRQELEALTVGERDRRLLEARRRLLGDALRTRVICPVCHADLELNLDAAGMSNEGDPVTSARIYELRRGPLLLRFRLPTSADLIAVETSPDEATGLSLLLKRCLVEAKRGGHAVAAADLTEPEVAHLADGMVAADPHAEILLECCCAACGHSWQVLFDIASFFTEELEALAGRLLSEVHALAWGYGWSEADVLEMSPRRRRAYLEMLGA